MTISPLVCWGPRLNSADLFQSNDRLTQWRFQLLGLSDRVALIRGMDAELEAEETAQSGEQLGDTPSNATSIATCRGELSIRLP